MPAVETVETLEIEPVASFPMTADRMRWCLAVIGWSQRECGRRLDVHETNIRAMARNIRPIPDELNVWLETLARVHQALPTPFGWENTAGKAGGFTGIEQD